MAQTVATGNDRVAGVYYTSISVLGLATFAYASYRVVTAPFQPEWILLSIVTVALVSRIDIGLPRTSSTVTLSDAFIFISVLLYGAWPSIVLAGADAAICTLQFKSRRRILWFNVAVMSLSVLLASTAVAATFGDLRALAPDLKTSFIATGMLALIHYAVNSGIVSVEIALRKGQGVIATWKQSFMWTSISYFAGAAAACLIVKLITLISFYAFIIAVPIVTITYFTYKVYLDKVEASNQHAEHMADLHLRTIEALAIAIDAKDEVTHDHVHRVQVYATGLARLFGLSEPEIEALRAGALLHDIGKLAVPDYILNKPGELTPAEIEKMKVHTVVGAEILERVGFPYPVVPVVRHHHEWWDGSGYPDGLKGDQIPMTARILTAADCFDAVREERQYRRAMTREEAIQLLRQGSGTVFDPTVVSVFLEHLPDFEAEIRRQRIEPQVSAQRSGRSDQRVSSSNTGASALERIRHSHREVITLYDIAQTIGSSLDLRDRFAVFSARLADMVSYTTCVLYLQRQDSTEIEVAHVVGAHADKFKGRRMPSGAGISGWVVANRTSMLNCDPRLDLDVMRLELVDQYRSAMVAPLIRDGQGLGALAVYTAEAAAYEPDHLRVLEAVAKLASDAAANAVQLERMEATALSDPMTGLPNARALRHRFDEESDRALRHRDVFSLVMMDLDGFKEVNDRLGHQAGDVVLRDFTRFLQRQLRGSDFVARYAGDEFVALLQIGPEDGVEMVSRIQRELEQLNFGPAGERVALGFSAGFAAFGADGKTLDELLLAADRAMYANKARRKASPTQSGRLGTANLRPYRVS